jgi:AcrR family transcriptional regulator
MRPVPRTTAAKVMAAPELIADRGLDDTKIDDLATATRVPKPTLYYYFEGKEEILSYIFGVVLDAVGDAVAAGMVRQGTAAERLARVVARHLEVFATYPKASQAPHFDLGRATRRPELAARIETSYVDPVAQLLWEGAEEGTLRGVVDPRLTAVAILGATSTAAIHVLAIDDRSSLDELLEVLVPLVLDGLRPATKGGADERDTRHRRRRLGHRSRRRRCLPHRRRHAAGLGHRRPARHRVRRT